jgi:hypothetical protein
MNAYRANQAIDHQRAARHRWPALTAALIGLSLLAGCVTAPLASPAVEPGTPVPTAVPTATATPTATPTAEPATPSPAPPSPTAVEPGRDRTNPLAIERLPFSYTLDTRQSPAGPAAADECFGWDSRVWFAYTPAHDAVVAATTFGSDYDTTLTVAQLFDAGRHVTIGCNDDAGSGLQSAFRFEAEAGSTYLFGVGSFEAGATGWLAFNLDVAPEAAAPAVAMTINRRGHVDAAGRAVVSGTITCSVEAGFVQLEVSIRQRVERQIIQGWGEAEVHGCSPAGVEWTALVESYELAFGDEPAVAQVIAVYCDEWDCAFGEAEREIRLRTD